jgi:transforming growth factor-beta-induced protein
MQNSKPTRKLAAIAALLAIVLAACGGGGSSDTPESAPATTQAPTPTTEPMAEPTEPMAGPSAMNSGPGCSAVPMDGEGSFDGMADDPAATAASNNPVLSTLVTAVSEAGLVDTLNGDGPFTIFAPTNDAFAAIPEDQLNAILGDPELLTSILTYHVVAGEDADLADLIESGSVTTVQGEELEIASDGELASINGASVVCGNVQTANATVHIIDEVLVPAG